VENGEKQFQLAKLVCVAAVLRRGLLEIEIQRIQLAMQQPQENPGNWENTNKSPVIAFISGTIICHLSPA